MSRKRRHRQRRARREAAQVAAPESRCGRYELLERLAAGGMAEVFRARVRGSAGFERDVVLKRLHPANADDPEFVEMFTDEARLLGYLHHPNVVEALDFYKQDGKLFLVLEHVPGPSLSRVLRSGHEVPPAI